MESAKIEKLLAKYFEAETTLEEEKLLREYFLSGKVADRFVKYKTLFESFNSSKQEVSKKGITLPQKRTRLQWMRIASIVVLLLSVYIGKDQYQNYKLRKQYAQVNKALQMVSVNLNKGKDVFYTMSSSINRGELAIAKLHVLPSSMKKANQIITK